MTQITTNLFVFFSSEGDEPSKVTEKLAMLGFTPHQGSADYVYHWQKKPTLDELLLTADRITHILKGSRVNFNIETNQER